jgi:hypothetical protein
MPEILGMVTQTGELMTLEQIDALNAPGVVLEPYPGPCPPPTEPVCPGDSFTPEGVPPLVDFGNPSACEPEWERDHRITSSEGEIFNRAGLA